MLIFYRRIRFNDSFDIIERIGELPEGKLF
jgi:hypothetical protein